MVKPVKQVAAGEFKATCLRLLDEVADEGQEFLVTKRGTPVARLVPLKKAKRRPPEALKGSVIRFDRPNDPFFEVSEDWPDVVA